MFPSGWSALTCTVFVIVPTFSALLITRMVALLPGPRVPRAQPVRLQVPCEEETVTNAERRPSLPAMSSTTTFVAVLSDLFLTVISHDTLPPRPTAAGFAVLTVHRRHR